MGSPYKALGNATRRETLQLVAKFELTAGIGNILL